MLVQFVVHTVPKHKGITNSSFVDRSLEDGVTVDKHVGCSLVLHHSQQTSIQCKRAKNCIVLCTCTQAFACHPSVGTCSDDKFFRQLSFTTFAELFTQRQKNTQTSS